MSVRRSLAAGVALAGIVALPLCTAGPASASTSTHKWGTSDAGKRAGTVVFKESGDWVKVCDTNAGDESYVTVRIYWGGKYRDYVPDGPNKACRYSSAKGSKGNFKLNMPEGRKITFKLFATNQQSTHNYGQVTKSFVNDH